MHCTGHNTSHIAAYDNNDRSWSQSRPVSGAPFSPALRIVRPIHEIRGFYYSSPMAIHGPLLPLKERYVALHNRALHHRTRSRARTHILHSYAMMQLLCFSRLHVLRITVMFQMRSQSRQRCHILLIFCMVSLLNLNSGRSHSSLTVPCCCACIQVRTIMHAIFCMYIKRSLVFMSPNCSHNCKHGGGSTEMVNSRCLLTVTGFWCRGGRSGGGNFRTATVFFGRVMSVEQSPPCS